MVRYTIALRGEPKDPPLEVSVSEEVVDLFEGDQLEERFLENINSMGQVPVLTSPSLSRPIADSLEITHFLSKLYPSLLPASHAEEINTALDALHSINFFSLSFSSRPQASQAMKEKVQNKLNQAIEEGNEKYQKALEYKMSIVESHKIEGLKADVIAMNVEKTRNLMINLERNLPQEDGQKGPNLWQFGLDKPTALDAHLVVFIERMRDIGRSELIPKGLQTYADRAKMGKAWKLLMKGHSTMVENK